MDPIVWMITGFLHRRKFEEHARVCDEQIRMRHAHPYTSILEPFFISQLSTLQAWTLLTINYVTQDAMIGEDGS